MKEDETLKQQIERQKRERAEVAEDKKQKIEEEGYWAWFRDGFNEQAEEMAKKDEIKREERKELRALQKEEDLQIKKDSKRRIKEIKANNIAHCPKCKSTSVEYIEKRKIGIVRGIVGGELLGPVGAAAGALSKKPKGKMKCLNCGKEWKRK